MKGVHFYMASKWQKLKSYRIEEKVKIVLEMLEEGKHRIIKQRNIRLIEKH